MTDILGRGWAFPVTTDGAGQVGMAEYEEDIAQAIVIILGTRKGERVLRPEFGCQIHDLIFAPNDANTVGLAIYYAEQALRMWEPRIRLLDVSARPDPDMPERLAVAIQYEIRTTLDRRTLVFPFYRIPGGRE
ncbi:GPW/gp25 family protein [Oscillochloris sp. ZM17-4]|nr:GPW/gp25 family protein [Oscillochloris sp. ZM17-4]